jgi:hypothetical protein
MFTVSSGFIGRFKIGDNINHNLDVLALLYRYSADGNDEDKRLLCKPVTVALISIVEAMLYDFHLRCRDFTQEGVAALSETTLAYIRQLGRIDEFATCIASAKRHNLFYDGDGSFYETLEELRKLRNRIHIQNTKGQFEPDERDAFSTDRRTQAERALEKVAKALAQKYPRKKHVQGYVRDFQMPWREHFRTRRS